MQTRRLGNSELGITRIGFGAWAIGGSWKFGWGAQDDTDSIAAIHEALEAGVNWIDTAAIYGLGHSEEVVARALADWSGERPYVFTKCSMRWDTSGEVTRSLKAASVRDEVEQSLKRLQTETIDLYQIHWPNPDNEIEEGWAELAKLKAEGKLRCIGVSNFNVAQLERARAIAPVTSLQPPYSLLERGIEADVLPYCGEHEIGVIGYSPMESGLLTGTMTRERIAGLPADDWRRNNRDFKEPALTSNLELVEVIKKISDRHGCSAGEVAIAWALLHPAITGVIVGLRKAGQAAGVLGGADLVLSGQDIAEIDGFFAARRV